MTTTKSPKEQLEDMQEEESINKMLNWIRNQYDDKNIDEYSKNWHEYVEDYEKTMKEEYFQNTGNRYIEL